MTIEEGRFIPQEAINRNDAKLVLAPLGAAKRLLNETISEPEGLDLSSANILVGVKQITPEIKQYLIVLDEPLTQEPYFYLLNAVATIKNLRINDVVAHWEMPDRKTEGNKTYISWD